MQESMLCSGKDNASSVYGESLEKESRRGDIEKENGASRSLVAFGRQKVKPGSGMITYVFSRENQVVVWMMDIINKIMELERPTQSYVFIKEEHIN